MVDTVGTTWSWVQLTVGEDVVAVVTAQNVVLLQSNARCPNGWGTVSAIDMGA